MHFLPRNMHIIVLAILAALFPATQSLGQSPINSQAAMQPSKGRFLLHEMMFYRSIDIPDRLGGGDADEGIAQTQLSYGLTNRLAIQADLPLVYRNDDRDSALSSDDDDFGIGSTLLLAKLRLWQHDTGPVNTSRIALIGGLQVPGTDDEFSMDSSLGWDPIVGAVFSTVQGRHGFNVDFTFELDTERDHGTADTLRVNGSWLYRLAPSEYTAETDGAWYTLVELNSVLETNGDTELFLSPGVMYEARRYTLDATIQIPVHQGLDHREEAEIVVGVGIRFPF